MTDHEPCAFCGKHARNTDADQSDVTLCPLCDLGRTFALGGVDTDSHIARALFAEAEARCVAILPPAHDADDRAELNAWFDARRDEAIEAHAADADQSTRDDGLLFHDRLPCEDVDSFNPCIIARAPIAAPLEQLPAWMERRHGGGDPIGTGLPVGWEVAS